MADLLKVLDSFLNVARVVLQMALIAALLIGIALAVEGIYLVRNSIGRRRIATHASSPRPENKEKEKKAA